MAYQKIKKSELTMTSMIITILLVMGMFFAGYLWIKYNSDQSGIVIDPKYDDTFTRLETQQVALDEDVNTVKNAVKGISEADSTFQVAWNGLKGLGSSLMLVINFLDSALNVMLAMFIPIDFIPSRYIALAIIGIIAVVVLLIVSILKGDPKT